MFDGSDPKMLWLNISNIALGIVTLVCWMVVGYGLVQEVLARKRKSKNTPVISDDHTFLVPGIGVTMTRSSPTNRFSRLDLPALGSPAITTLAPSRHSFPL